VPRIGGLFFHRIDFFTGTPAPQQKYLLFPLSVSMAEKAGIYLYVVIWINRYLDKPLFG